MAGHAEKRERMVERQLRRRGITDERVLAAMATIPRERFVPEEIRDRAYADAALPIGHGQTISQPWIVAAICQALGLEGGETVLEIGGGSGYSAAILAQLAERVTSIELIPELAAVGPRRAGGARARAGAGRGGRRRRLAGPPRRRRRTTRSPSTRPRPSRRGRSCSSWPPAGGWWRRSDRGRARR